MSNAQLLYPTTPQIHFEAARTLSSRPFPIIIIMTGRVVIIMVVEQYQYCTFTLPIRVREREEHKNRALQQQHMKQRIVFAPCYMYTY